MINDKEIKKGILETRKYVLSHHEPNEYHHCYTIDISGEPVRLCARCLGIYPGIGVGILVGDLTIPNEIALLLISLLPIFALVDWSVTTFTERRGKNTIRTFTGLLLGIAYGLGIILLLRGELIIIAVGLPYFVVVGVLLWKSYTIEYGRY